MYDLEVQEIWVSIPIILSPWCDQPFVSYSPFRSGFKKIFYPRLKDILTSYFIVYCIADAVSAGIVETTPPRRVPQPVRILRRVRSTVTWHVHADRASLPPRDVPRYQLRMLRHRACGDPHEARRAYHLTHCNCHRRDAPIVFVT